MTASIRKDFSSDNITGVAPEILAALTAASAGTVHSYGADPFTERLKARADALFECPVTLVPVATGTAANAIALSALARPWQAVYCPASAHVNTDECGAPEFFSGGAKLLGLPTLDGRLVPGQLTGAVAFARSMGVHHVEPAAVTLSQATEWGTIYDLNSLRRLCDEAHGLGLRVHVDGARFANALARLGCSAADATWRAGVDALTFGATKNGALAAEAIVVFDPSLASELEYRRKRSGHLWSKHRFLSAQLFAYLEDDLWLRHARRANAMADRLAAGLAAIDGAACLQPVDANELFVHLPARVIGGLRADGFEFYDWPAPSGTEGPVVRLVTSWDMEDADIDRFVASALRAAHPA
jgi:threonine aldolase